MSNNFQIGNKVKCIIRAYHCGIIGNTAIEYDNQPYTVLNDISARFQFQKKENDASSQGVMNLIYNTGFISSISLYDVNLNEKILNLIYPKSEAKLISTSQNCNSDDNNFIYLSLPSEKIYQVFIYNIDGQLEKAYATLENGQQIVVKNRNSNYLVFYSYYKENQVAFSLDKRDNLYLTLDFELIGNTDGETSKSWIHIEKCCLGEDKNLLFDNSSKTVNLTFKVVDNKNNYIVFEQ